MAKETTTEGLGRAQKRPVTERLDRLCELIGLVGNHAIEEKETKLTEEC